MPAPPLERHELHPPRIGSARVLSARTIVVVYTLTAVLWIALSARVIGDVVTVLGHPPASCYADPTLIERLVHPEDRHLIAFEPGSPQLADAVVVRVAR